MRPSWRARREGARPLYVLSGDGVFNEALNGLDADVPIGFIPGGGANVLPRALGLPRDPVAAARKLVEGNAAAHLARSRERQTVRVRRGDRSHRRSRAPRRSPGPHGGARPFREPDVRLDGREGRGGAPRALRACARGRRRGTRRLCARRQLRPVHLRGARAGPRRTGGSVRARPRPPGAAKGQRRIRSASPARIGHRPWRGHATRSTVTISTASRSAATRRSRSRSTARISATSTPLSFECERQAVRALV